MIWEYPYFLETPIQPKQPGFSFTAHNSNEANEAKTKRMGRANNDPLGTLDPAAVLINGWSTTVRSINKNA